MDSSWITTRLTRTAAAFGIAAGLVVTPIQPSLAESSSNTSSGMPPIAPDITGKPAEPAGAAGAALHSKPPTGAAQDSHPAGAARAGSGASREARPQPSAQTPALHLQSQQAVVAPTAPKTIDRNVAQQTAQVTELEKVMFGTPTANATLEQRLDHLESEVFHATTPEWDAQKRIDRLTQTLVGTGSATAPYPPSRLPLPDEAMYPPAAPMQQPMNYNQDPYLNGYSGADYGQPAQQPASPAAQQRRPINMPPQPNLDSPEFTHEATREDAEKYALEFVNEIRAANGQSPLGWDEIAYKVAQQHVADLCARSTVSHSNSQGENPDLRYTRAGGTDAMLEGLISLKSSGRVPITKGLVYRVIKELSESQDDRDALLSPYATQFAFSLNNNARNDKVIAVSEVVTDVAELEPIPNEIKVGEKIAIKGHIKGPYQFNKITLAWEGLNPDAAKAVENEEEQDEALPYFPPLDYTAYAKSAEHDNEKLRRVLQIGALGAVLAGSFFVPPVALAAPLIVATGPGKVKPLSEIPIKGGVKVNGNSFEHKTSISKDNKEGIYYITVWVTDGYVNPDDPTANPPFAISRRAIIAKPADGTETAAKQNRKELLTAADGKNKDADENK